MLALFDTNIYIGDLSDTIPETQTQLWRSQYVIRLSPIVHHELLRGAKEKRWVDEIKQKTVMTPAPTANMWEKSAEVLRELVIKYGLNEQMFRLQNDVLLALTARHVGALVISQDKHFLEIAKIIPFHFLHYRGGV